MKKKNKHSRDIYIHSHKPVNIPESKWISAWEQDRQNKQEKKRMRGWENFWIEFHYTYSFYLFRLINKFKANALHFNGKVLFYLTTMPCHTEAIALEAESKCVYRTLTTRVWVCPANFQAMSFLLFSFSLPSPPSLSPPDHVHMQCNIFTYTFRNMIAYK